MLYGIQNVCLYVKNHVFYHQGFVSATLQSHTARWSLEGEQIIHMTLNAESLTVM